MLRYIEFTKDAILPLVKSERELNDWRRESLPTCAIPKGTVFFMPNGELTDFELRSTVSNEYGDTFISQERIPGSGTFNALIVGYTEKIGWFFRVVYQPSANKKPVSLVLPLEETETICNFFGDLDSSSCCKSRRSKTLIPAIESDGRKVFLSFTELTVTLRKNVYGNSDLVVTRYDENFNLLAGVTAHYVTSLCTPEKLEESWIPASVFVDVL